MTVKQESMISWAEKRSRENLVGMYRQELLKIIERGYCSKLIPRGVRKRLRRDGILEKSGNQYTVTLLGKKILGVKDSEKLLP